MNLTELETKTKDELVDVAKDLGVEKPTALRKQDLVFRIMQAKAEREGNYFAGGILEMASDGYGFLRTQGLKPSLSDVYVSQTQVRRFALRTRRLRDGRRPAAQGVREVLRPAARGRRQRPRPGDGQAPPVLRAADADLPGRADPAWKRA